MRPRISGYVIDGVAETVFHFLSCTLASPSPSLVTAPFSSRPYCLPRAASPARLPSLPPAQSLEARNRWPSEWVAQGVYRFALWPDPALGRCAGSEQAAPPLRTILERAYVGPAPAMVLLDWDHRVCHRRESLRIHGHHLRALKHRSPSHHN